MMTRLDIKSFEKDIKKIDEQIRKLEERKAKLRDKIHNTVEYPMCKYKLVERSLIWKQKMYRFLKHMSWS